jgi:hypothetical protein
MDDQRGPIDGDGGQPHPSDMERRVTALATDMREIKADLKRLISDVAEIKRVIPDVAELKRDIAEIKRDVLGTKLDVAEIKGRLSQTPTTIQLISLVFGIMAAAFAVLKFTGHS